jgi:hypothetical protein
VLSDRGRLSLGQQMPVLHRVQPDRARGWQQRQVAREREYRPSKGDHAASRRAPQATRRGRAVPAALMAAAGWLAWPRPGTYPGRRVSYHAAAT